MSDKNQKRLPLILEAFSIRLRAETQALMAERLERLKSQPNPTSESAVLPAQPSAQDILQTWLTEILRRPLPKVLEDPTRTFAEQDAAWQQRHLTSVIHTEVARLVVDGRVHFQGRSPSGQRLLDTLYEYCDSYDQWLFSRWLHHLNASDFESAPKPPRSPEEY